MHAEALFLVDDHQAQVLEAHVLLDQAVGADHDVGAALGEPLEHGAGLLAGAEARQQFHPDGPVSKPVAEGRVVLLGEQGGRHQQGHLPACLDRDEGGAQGHLGLAETDVTADHAVHRQRRFEVGNHRVDGVLLVRRLLVGEAGGKLGVQALVHRKGKALAGLAARVQVEQFGGHVADLFRGLALRGLPLAAAQAVQRRRFRVAAGVAADQVEGRDRHVQLVAAVVFQHQELGRPAVDLEGFQALVTAHAMVFVDHRRALGEIVEVADDGFRVAVAGRALGPGAAAAAEQL